MNKQKRALWAVIFGILAIIFSSLKLCTEFQDYEENYAKISGKNYIIEKQDGNEWIYLEDENYVEE